MKGAGVLVDDLGVVRQSRGDARRQAMLLAAMEVFLNEGYAGASVDMVIARSGGSRKTLYDYFGNKEGLFLATIEYHSARFSSRLAELKMNSAVPEQALFEAGRAFFNAIVAPEMLSLYRTIIAEAYRFPRIGTAVLREGHDKADNQVATYLESQHDAGRLKIKDSDVAAKQFLALVTGDLHRRVLLSPDFRPTKTEIDRHVRMAVSTFLYGVGRNPSAENKNT